MALYCYLKAYLPVAEKPPKKDKLFSLFLLGTGVIILGAVLFSFGFYQWQAGKRFEYKPHFVSAVALPEVLGESQTNLNEPDYSQPRYWFTDPPVLPPRPSQITHYNLSLPALGIKKAVVEIGGQDLDQSMVQYSGTALPGEIGNAVIFCHSVLPQFFNPKNYKTICSTLPTLDLGDEILVFFDGIRYLYQVVEMFEVAPDDVSVLNQPTDGEYLSMITCVPPGTYLRRLVVKSRLIY